MAKIVLQNEKRVHTMIKVLEDMVSSDYNKLVDMHSKLRKLVSCFPLRYFCFLMRLFVLVPYDDHFQLKIT